MANIQYYGTGRRKRSTARVYLRPGEGKIVINDKPLDAYFTIARLRHHVLQPLTLTEVTDKFDVYINLSGGGTTGQAGAARHGVSRALLQYNPEFRKKLKSAGFLTRDAREVERKKYGQRKARARFQYSKR